MIHLIAHRGFWKEPSEQNTRIAFLRALDHGFGIETDVRDHAGKTWIAHDPIQSSDGLLAIDSFFDLPFQDQTIAINIKSTGLLGSFLRIPKLPRSMFFFDAPYPDSRAYSLAGLPIYHRVSEEEFLPNNTSQRDGIWVDQWNSQWFGLSKITEWQKLTQRICFVSPELHGRDPKDFWLMLRSGLRDTNVETSMCTDIPDQAQEFFNCDSA